MGFLSFLSLSLFQILSISPIRALKTEKVDVVFKTSLLASEG